MYTFPYTLSSVSSVLFTYDFQTVATVALYFLRGDCPDVAKLLPLQLAPVNLNAKNVRVYAQTFSRFGESQHCS